MVELSINIERQVLLAFNGFEDLSTKELAQRLPDTPQKDIHAAVLSLAIRHLVTRVERGVYRLTEWGQVKQGSAA